MNNPSTPASLALVVARMLSDLSMISVLIFYFFIRYRSESKPEMHQSKAPRRRLFSTAVLVAFSASMTVSFPALPRHLS